MNDTICAGRKGTLIRTVTIGKAQSSADWHKTPNIRIDICGTLPDLASIAAWDDYCNDQASHLEAALRDALPGGIYDRLLGYMLAYKATHFRVPHNIIQHGGEITMPATDIDSIIEHATEISANANHMQHLTLAPLIMDLAHIVRGLVTNIEDLEHRIVDCEQQENTPYAEFESAIDRLRRRTENLDTQINRLADNRG